MTSVDALAGFLDASPSPWHAVSSAAAMLDAEGYIAVDEAAAPWTSVPRGYVIRGGALVAWCGDGSIPGSFRIVGAHTDSPGLRVKPLPDTGKLGWRQLGVEVYGGALTNSWLDRDLGVAGRLVERNGTARLVRVDEPVARVPQLAIHLDRDVGESGLKLDRQAHLTPVWGTGKFAPGEFAEWIAAMASLERGALAAWELCLYDITPAAVLGADRTLFASGRLDNLVSCWAATTALRSCAQLDDGTCRVVALFDHEEVGSQSSVGASGPLLETVLERLVLAAGGGREHLHRAFAASTCISADNAHAVHPNYPERHEPDHCPLVNHGPALKLNSNQRYGTSAETAAVFQRACEAAGVPWQVFVSRNNMPCGSTIGPLSATRLGIATVDVGVPQLSMHSARELCGADDPLHLQAALAAYYAGA